MIRLLRLLLLTALLAGVSASADDLSNPIGVRPISASFAVNPGPATYLGESRIDPASLYDPRYKLKSISIMDITIATVGPDLGKFNGSIKVTIGTDGRVSDVEIVESVHPTYDSMLLRAARSWLYQPAKRNDVPVVSELVVEVNLRPRE